MMDDAANQLHISEQGQRLHEELLVVDSLRYFLGPLDELPKDMADTIEEQIRSGSRRSEIDIYDMITRRMMEDPVFRDEYLEQWGRSGVDLVNQTVGMVGNSPKAWDEAVRSIAMWTQVFDSIKRIAKVTTTGEALRAKRDGKYGVILGFQDTTFLQGEMTHLDIVYRLGVRIVQLTYNMMNDMGTGCTERVDAGLSHKGVQLIRRLNELGILVDAAHCSSRTVLDAVEVSRRPIALTHVTCHSLFPHDRGKRDEVLRAVAEAGGYVGVAIVPAFLTERETVAVDDYLDHVDHAVETVGVEHVGIGTDWGACYPPVLAAQMNAEMGESGFRPEHRLDFGVRVDGFERWTDWPNLTRGLVSRGYSEREMKYLLGQSFLDVFERAVG